MNTAQNNGKLANAIIARWDNITNEPVAFFADEIYHGTIPAYYEGKGVVEVSEERYDATVPMNPSDVEKVLANYKRFAGVEEVVVKHRRRYTKDMSKIAPRLADINEETGEVSVSQELVDQTEDKKVKEVLQKMADKGKTKRKYTKRSDFWAPEVPKGRARHAGRAKTIEAQTATQEKAKNARSEAAKERFRKELEQTAQKQAAQNEVVQAQGSVASPVSEDQLRAMIEAGVQAALATMQKAA